MLQFILVFVGGGTGCVVRYALTLVLPKTAGEGFPWPTFAANLALLAFSFRHLVSPSSWLLLSMGFCGGLSTFSTFSLETVQLINNGHWATAGLYVFISLVSCVLTIMLVNRMPI